MVPLKVNIYKFLTVIDPRQTFSSEPFRECRNHNSDSKDIFDIAWGSSLPNSNTILTACSDFTVYIYNIMTKNTSVASQFFDRPVQILKHPDLVSAAQFKIGVSFII
jgi:WD40 repeat protein